MGCIVGTHSPLAEHFLLLVLTLMPTKATIAMSLLCVFAVYPIRKYKYELFLLLHMAFAVLFLISMW